MDKGNKQFRGREGAQSSITNVNFTVFLFKSLKSKMVNVDSGANPSCQVLICFLYFSLSTLNSVYLYFLNVK